MKVEVYFFVTLLLGGGCAWMTGRAVARAWQRNLRLFLYVVLLVVAVRFLHFALFHETLLSAGAFMIDLATLTVIGLAGKYTTRTRQMACQYRRFCSAPPLRDEARYDWGRRQTPPGMRAPPADRKEALDPARRRP